MTSSVSVDEGPIVRRAAILRLQGDTVGGGVNTLVGGRVYRGQAPHNSVLPYISVYDMSTDVLLTQNAIHVFATVDILVKIVDTGKSDVRVDQIGSRVLQVLDGYGQVTIDGVYVVQFRWTDTQPQNDEVDGDLRYMYRNYIFRSEAEPA